MKAELQTMTNVPLDVRTAKTRKIGLMPYISFSNSLKEIYCAYTMVLLSANPTYVSSSTLLKD
jgi:hypothetical protein